MIRRRKLFRKVKYVNSLLGKVHFKTGNYILYYILYSIISIYACTPRCNANLIYTAIYT